MKQPIHSPPPDVQPTDPPDPGAVPSEPIHPPPPDVQPTDPPDPGAVPPKPKS